MFPDWHSDVFGWGPRWTAEPDLEAAQHILEKHLRKPTISYSFLTRGRENTGAFNRVYCVTTDHDDSPTSDQPETPTLFPANAGTQEPYGNAMILRISRSVEPGRKTLSEVATLGWVRKYTTIPVPVVLTFNDFNDNPVGFEWILMTKLPGNRLVDEWTSMSWEAKKALTKQLARYASELFSIKLGRIGNFYDPYESKPKIERQLGMSVFAVDRMPLHNIAHGPSRCARDWLNSRLDHNKLEYEAIKAYCSEFSNVEKAQEWVDDASEKLDMVGKLKAAVASICVANFEWSILCHEALHMDNILVDDSGALTGVIDWQFVGALPLRVACDYPALLRDKRRYIRSHPIHREEHAKDKLDDMFADMFDDTFNDDSVLPLLGLEIGHSLEGKLKYELIALRHVFREEMRRLEPAWMTIYQSRSSVRYRDLFAAVQHHGDVDRRPLIYDWLNDNYGSSHCLLDKFDEM